MIPRPFLFKVWVIVVCGSKMLVFTVNTAIHLLTHGILGNNRIIAEALNDFRLKAIDHSRYHIAHLEYICHRIKKKAE